MQVSTRESLSTNNTTAPGKEAAEGRIEESGEARVAAEVPTPGARQAKEIKKEDGRPEKESGGKRERRPPAGKRCKLHGEETGSEQTTATPVGKPTIQQPPGNRIRPLVIAQFVALLVAMKTFSVSALKRRMNALWDQEQAKRTGKKVEASRNSLDIDEMFDPLLCVPGEYELPPGRHNFDLPAMNAWHVKSCARCGREGEVQEGCYFWRLRRCITHGFNPPYVTEIEKAYETRGNNKLSKVFSHSFDKAVLKMISERVLLPWTAESGFELKFINPLGIVLKNSDKARAKVATGVRIIDQETLDEANQRLSDQQMKPVKTRVSMNNTANGGNAALYKPRFKYAGSEDATNLMQRNDFLGKGDVERYFLNFPLAQESFQYFGVCALLGQILHFVMVFFGLSSAPYYTSVWGAEIRRWVQSMGVPAVHFVDDWLTAAPTLAEVKRRMGVIVAILVSVGLSMAEDKFEYGQQLVFLGILYDTVKMTMAFDAVQCQVVGILLRDYRERLVKNTDIQYTDIVQLCGKLNWFGEILQAGRVHTAAWWRYSAMPAGRQLTDEHRARLIADTDWWLEVVDKWSVSDHTEKAFPIISASELLADPLAVAICCSDMSGPDGWGCYYGTLEEMESDPSFVSVRWREGFKPHSSMWGELKALREYLDFPDRQGKLLVWVSDSLSGVWCINKGRAHTGEERELVEDILEKCDELRIVIVALWVPREENQYADYLSHLATYMNRDAVAGRCSTLDDPAADHHPRAMHD